MPPAEPSSSGRRLPDSHARGVAFARADAAVGRPINGPRSCPMRQNLLATGAMLFAALAALLPQPPASRAGPGVLQGQGLILELDNEFIKNYENRATITSEY